jgi:hypothetical protein
LTQQTTQPTNYSKQLSKSKTQGSWKIDILNLGSIHMDCMNAFYKVLEGGGG